MTKGNSDLIQSTELSRTIQNFLFRVTMQHTEVSAVRGPAHHYCAKRDHIASDNVSTSGRSWSQTKFTTCAEMKPSIRLCMCV